ncbi:putative Protein lifeguard 1 [Hypsibius exemplaris]|uniref:Protein lifeguard 1 n=1 Tax=Hypsibius exemplaris TaxID=2072580 RepID=A0A1W0WH08_HYPEX|nr:putative Protein lifeguard 1 [Hypsibius exemplaris]
MASNANSQSGTFNQGYNPGVTPYYAGAGASPAYQQNPELGQEIPKPHADPSVASPNFQFTEKSLRLGFIRKVYSILTLQLLVTFGFVALCVLEENIKRFVQANYWIVLIAWAIIFTTVILLTCFRNVARTSPGNYIILSVLTLAMSLAVGTSASLFEAEEVIMAMGITVAMTLALTAFSFQTKYDFTYRHGFLLIGLIGLIFFGMFAGIWHSRVLGVFYGFLGAMVFGMFLVVDTQLMLGGRHKFSYSPEDYIFAALSLYLDIINMFLYILQIFGASR